MRRSNRLTGAGDGIRTRDPKLGKLVLYQLSYTRTILETEGNLNDVVGVSQALIAAI